MFARGRGGVGGALGRDSLVVVALSDAASRTLLSLCDEPHTWRGGLLHLGDHQDVLLRVAEPEHRRDRVAHAADRVVDVDAGGLEVGVDSLDVIGVQDDPGLRVAGRLPGGRRGDRDRRDRAGRGDFDPAVVVAERDVGALLEAERVDVELERLVLVGDRDADDAELVDTGCGGAHAPLTDARGKTHRCCVSTGRRAGRATCLPGWRGGYARVNQSASHQEESHMQTDRDRAQRAAMAACALASVFGAGTPAFANENGNDQGNAYGHAKTDASASEQTSATTTT